LNRKGLAAVLILLFIVSIVAPTIIGYKTNSTEIYKKYNLDSYHIPEVYNNEKQIRSNPVPDIFTSNALVSYKETTAPSTVLSPMNSSWPMYCHDLRHTGQSPYSTANTTGVEKWRTALPIMMEGSPVIDKNGIIYVGCDDLFAFYPNGTVKWNYSLIGWIQSAPAVDENGIIYVGSVTAMPNYLYAFYPDGTLKWKYATGDSVYSSPVIGNDGTIYFG
jgi:outer membrane protein assembly factor BamB